MPSCSVCHPKFQVEARVDPYSNGGNRPNWGNPGQDRMSFSAKKRESLHLVGCPHETIVSLLSSRTQE
jgi:hypothetical protein